MRNTPLQNLKVFKSAKVFILLFVCACLPYDEIHGQTTVFYDDFESSYSTISKGEIVVENDSIGKNTILNRQGDFASSNPTVLYDDFESGLSANWTGGVNSDKLIVEDDGTGDNNILKVRGGIFDSNSTIKWVENLLTEPTTHLTPVKLSFDYYRPDISLANDKIDILGVDEGNVSVHIQIGKIFVRTAGDQTTRVDLVPTGSPLHIDFFFDPASGYTEVLVDGELHLEESLPAGATYPRNFDGVGLNTYAQSGYFTLDNVALYDDLNIDVNLDEDFEGELCHYQDDVTGNSSYQTAYQSGDDNYILQVISDGGNVKLVKYVADLNSNVFKAEWDHKIPQNTDQTISVELLQDPNRIHLGFLPDGSVHLKERNGSLVTNSAPGVVNADTWHKMLTVFNKTNNEIKVYVDGVEVLNMVTNMVMENPYSINFYSFSDRTFEIDNVKVWSDLPHKDKLRFPIRSNQAHPSLLMEESDYPALAVKQLQNSDCPLSNTMFDVVRNVAAQRWDESNRDLGEHLGYN
ncbi:MAG: hypothetical protein AAGD96_03355, partial [Chloroflexota bacterium]